MQMALHRLWMLVLLSAMLTTSTAVKVESEVVELLVTDLSLEANDTESTSNYCTESSMSTVCKCGYRQGLFTRVCNECLDNKKWGYGCDLQCPSTCKFGCNFIGECHVPHQCQASRRVEAPLSYKPDKRLNERGECQDCLQNDPGYWGLWCEHKCPSTCKESSVEGFCTRAGNCYRCVDGWYGEKCDKRCPSSCKTCIMRDNMVRMPDSSEDYWPAGTCSLEERCTTDSWGPRCEQHCPQHCSSSHVPSCLRESGACIKCQDNLWWGEACEKPVPEGCKTRAGRYPKGVDRKTGKCEIGCKVGYFGEMCEYKCSPNCLNDACGEKSVCTDGCKLGFWGPLCDKSCPEHTKTDKGCHRDTGMPLECERAWHPGYHHKEAAAAAAPTDGNSGWDLGIFLGEEQLDNSTGEPGCLKCSEMCKREGEGAVCDHQGRCLQGCVRGFHGPRCEEQCPPRCKGACDIRATGYWDGHCEACQPGFAGSQCTEKCDAKCESCLKVSKNVCTSCRYNEPAELDERKGTCSCIAGASRVGSSHKCTCISPDDRQKLAFFDVEPHHQCRQTCKPGLKEVFRQGESRCVTHALYTAVLKAGLSDKLQQGRCADAGDIEVPVPGGSLGGYECLHREYVEYIMHE